MVPYSFQSDASVPIWDYQRPLIVFDGECVLCSGFVRFVHARDKAGEFLFTSAQSNLGQTLYRHYVMDTRNFESNLVILDGSLHVKMDSFAAVVRRLGWPWKILSVFGFLPRIVTDSLYDAIARNRYRIFGRYVFCMMPSPEMRSRIID